MFLWGVLLFGAYFAGNVGSHGVQGEDDEYVEPNNVESIFQYFPIFGSTNAARLGRQRAQQVNEPAPEGISPCMRELGTRGNGRYPRQIAAQFLPGIVIPFDAEDESRQNLMCSCISYDHMICMLWVQPDSFAHQVVLRRLDRSDPNELRPFYVLNDAAMSSSMEPPIYFENAECDPRVYARIDISLRHDRLPMGTEIQFRKPQSEIDLFRAKEIVTRELNSAPASLHFPTRRFPLSLCNQGSDDAVCPIEQMPFKANDIVYVLKQDRENVEQRKPVCCISALGLKKIQRNSDDGIFREPLRRVEGSHLTIENDYDAYVIFDDTSDTVDVVEDFGSQAGPSFSSSSNQEIQAKPHTSDESSEIRPHMTDESAQANPQVVDEGTQARIESVDEGIQAQPRTSDEGVQTQYQPFVNSANAETQTDSFPEQEVGDSFTSNAFLRPFTVLLVFYILLTSIYFLCWKEKPPDYILLV